MLVPQDMFRMLFYGSGKQGRFDFKDININGAIYGELALGYMRKLNNKITVGLKLKGLAGLAGIHSNIEKMSIDATRDIWELEAKGDVYLMLPMLKYNAQRDTFENQPFDLSMMIPQGYGGAVDLGITIEPIKHLTISAAVTDLGFIRWSNKENTIQSSLDGKYKFEGVNFNIKGGEQALTDTLNKLQDNIKEALAFNHKQGVSQPITQWLTAAANVGVEYGILDNKISFAGLSNTRLYNQRVMQEYTLGVNFRPAEWFKLYLSHSLKDGRFKSVGAGVNIKLGAVNMFIVSDYIPGFINIQNAPLDNQTAQFIEKVPMPYTVSRLNLQAGLLLSFGKDSDKDRDGINDKRDLCPMTDIKFLQEKCPNTKKKEFVDENGCLIDADKDGIADCYDNCENTPEGVEVDSIGCPLDTDQDGVYDYLDQCPNTPQDITIDTNGCPLDTYQDGVADYLDRCPNTPQEAVNLVDKNGCDQDNDQDGVADYLDKCPNTPQGAKVNTQGCAKDSDQDGVADYMDKCPNTPQEAKSFIDENGCPKDTDGDDVLDYQDKCPNVKGVYDNNGCPAVSKDVLKVFKQALHGIQFAFGKATIRSKSYSVLNLVVDIMKNNPEYNLSIYGHTDSQGSDELNLKLSKDRAKAVRQYLIEKGIDEARLTSDGYGETKPVADNTTAKGRAENRRVEFVVSFERLVKDNK
ncbi:MAG: cell envelope biogenesis protein OmpA [Bacteroidales bacterium]|nr:MAG: cell envelope biogenesis protein OmpA [Bacteroidales bacterium]